MVEMPVWEKYVMSIDEAAAYFHIGMRKLRRLLDDNPDAPFIFYCGTKQLIKRKLFEKFIDENPAV